MNNSQKIFKILTLGQLEDFEKSGVFHGSDIDIKDGFIHLSFEGQWQGIWDKFFNKQEVYLMEISGLDPEFLKIEANKPNGEKYPHYYGPNLGKMHIKEVTKISAN